MPISNAASLVESTDSIAFAHVRPRRPEHHSRREALSGRASSGVIQKFARKVRASEHRSLRCCILDISTDMPAVQRLASGAQEHGLLVRTFESPN